jgi:magnesium transporter
MNPMAQLLEPEVRELVQAGRFAELRRALAELDPVDVSDVLDNLEPAQAAVAFRMLPREPAGEAFAHLDHDKQQRLIEELGADGALRVVEAMEPDDRADLLDELPSEVATRLMGAMSPQSRRITQEIMGYPAESVGRLMTPDYVRVFPDWTIAHAMDHIRRYGKDAETVHWVYVVDSRGRLLDDLHIRSLLLADPEATIASLMDNSFISLSARDDREEAVRVMARYDRTAMPVTDTAGHLVGIVTIDDVADVAEEEMTEDIQKLAGVQALKEPYTSIRLWDMVRKRGFGLCILFPAQVLTVLVLSIFEPHIQQVVLLALFVPLIISSGGNTGTQAASLLIRAIALDEVDSKDWWRVLRKELLTGLVLGLVLGGLGALAVLLFQMVRGEQAGEPALTWLAIGLAIVGVAVWAVTLGSMFPLILKRMGLDPAAISSPLVATAMDVSGLLIYFGVALVVLRGAI